MFATFIGLFVSSHAHAIMGEYVDPSEHPDYACKLVASDVVAIRTPINAKGKPIGAAQTVALPDEPLCSATLIGPQELLTASHCYGPITTAGSFRENDQGQLYQVQIAFGSAIATCGAKAGATESQKIFWSQGFPNPDYLRGAESFDVNVLRAPKAFSFKPVAVSKDYYQTISLLRNPKHCRIFGYGTDNNKQFGTLHGITADRFDVRNSFLTFISGKNNVAPGDSGGTLVCENSKGVPYLVGVTSVGSNANPKLPVGKTRISGFAPTSFNTNRRWIDFVQTQVPLTAKHTGERKIPGSANPPLDEFVAPFELYTELPGMMGDLANCVSDYRQFYKKRELKGYVKFLKDLKPIQLNIQEEFESYKRGDAVIKGRALYPVSKPGKYIQGDAVFSILMKEEFSYPRAQFVPAYTRMRIDQVLKILRTEAFSCFNQGLGHDGKGHGVLDRARENFQKLLEERVAQWE
ncbi:MAG: trypsin-like serine protease [Bdellovibrionales bacterium]|nr:trypsin-like serine protease [Bdellovibrionales bacterium]